MRYFILVAFISTSIVALAQSDAEIVSPEEYDAYLREDITNGRHVAWTKAQLKTEKKECVNGAKDIMKDANIVCDCMIDELAGVMNHVRFAEMSEYQKGKATATIGAQKCLKK